MAVEFMRMAEAGAAIQARQQIVRSEFGVH
jgi:hypothetical protein